MEDFRFQWFKEVIYKALSIDFNDQAFENLLEKNKIAVECLNNFISGSNETKSSVFFYCTVEEEEVEVQDVFEKTEASEKIELSESSESEKLDLENASIDDKVEDLENNEDDIGSMHKAGSSESVIESVNYNRLPRRSTTSLLQIIKKNVLHFALNVTTFDTFQRYVYFLNCKLDAIPILSSIEQAYSVMPEFFEIGSINQHPLISMKKIISEIYLPILKNEKWLPLVPSSDCEMDENQLLSAFNGLCKNIEEFLSSTEETVLHIEKPIMFSAPNIITDITNEELAQEGSFIIEAEEFVNEWAETMSDILRKSAKKKPPENNLLGEINFWKRQKLLLSTCYDHLSKSSIQQTIEILKIANSDINSFEMNMKEIEKNLKIATDNFNYLLLLEPLTKNLQPERSFEDTRKAVEDIFLLLKMIWIQSNYYKEDSNMCRLIKGIATLLKEKVKNNANVENLFRKQLSKVETIVTHSKKLLQFWKHQYFKECENIKKYGGSYWWGFEITVFFTETDHMIIICSDLEKVTMMLQELHNIFNTNLKYFVQDVKGLSALEVRVFGITSRIQYASFDIFDPAFKSEWDKIMETFLRDVRNLEGEIKLYISKMFRSTLSWENAYILTKSFNKISISSNIRDFIDKSRDDMFKQFVREIYEKENEFLSYKDEPPNYPGIPEYSSSIIWIEDLLLKLSQPTSQICDHSDLSKKESEVMERFKKAELLLKEYKLEKYNAWKNTGVEMLNKFLQESVLRNVTQVSNDIQRVLGYQVNFPIYLEEVSTEAKLFEYFGFDIPTFVKNVILQERTYYKQRHEIRITLENMKKSISVLKKHETSILGIPIENLCSVLDIGLNSIQWESSEISEFIKKLKRAVAVFRNLLCQTQNVFIEIDKHIESLSHCDLFHFCKCDAMKVPTCEKFFEDAEEEMDIKVQAFVNIHVSLQVLLKYLEKITCKTETGEAVQLKQYYRNCEEKILESLLKMMLSNLEYFKDEILENYVFPFIKLVSQSEDEFVKSSLNRAKLVFLSFLRNAVESLRKIIRWLNGTCNPSPTFYLEEMKEHVEFSYYLDICMHPLVKDLVLKILDRFFSYINEINQNLI